MSRFIWYVIIGLVVASFMGVNTGGGWLWLIIIALVIWAVIAKIKSAARVRIFRAEDFFRQQQGMPPHGADGMRAEDVHPHEVPPGWQQERQVHGTRTSSAEQMVACSSCGVYVPASEAFVYNGKVYCCKEHVTKQQA